ncbi:MAG: hypothetical protein KIT36_22110 [Alphaproteobacteria bacterium]|nr:hypothetical protein [Alphaproteobacteria bacterium]
MSETDPVGSDKDRALWARLKAASAADDVARLPAVFDEELAAWLDGRLPPHAAARVEARLAADPAMLSLALDTRAALHEAAGAPAPDRLVTRAQALVGFEVERQAQSGGSRLGRLGGWWRRLELAAVTGAFLVVCATGFSLGGDLQQTFAGDGERFDVAVYVANPLAESEVNFLADQGGQ